MESTSAPPSVPFQNKKDQASSNSADVCLLGTIKMRQATSAENSKSIMGAAQM